MDLAPHFDPETTSVCFYTLVRGVPVRAFVTREWLVSHFGAGIPKDAGIVDAYLAHAPVIDTEVSRRVARGRLEPIWLASSLAPLE